MISYEGIDKTDQLYKVAKRKIRDITKRPTNDELLLLYGLFKQAESGDNNTFRPWSIDPKSVNKWQAWKSHEGKPTNLVKEEYVEVVNKLLVKYE
jgi:diazepam-binding inhibitor (GABA receptor modulating acyl-CoA-binding protein)